MGTGDAEPELRGQRGYHMGRKRFDNWTEIRGKQQEL